MLTNLNRKIEIAANLAILVVAALLAFVVVRNHLLTGNLSETQVGFGGRGQIAVGSHLPSLNLDWDKNKQTLVPALSRNCHFCTDSAPFYRTLVQNKKDTRVVAVFPQTVEEGKNYLQEVGVNVDEIRQLPLERIGVRGTPTLILIDGYGAVKRSWVGKLPVEKQTDVLSQL